MGGFGQFHFQWHFSAHSQHCYWPHLPHSVRAPEEHHGWKTVQERNLTPRCLSVPSSANKATRRRRQALEGHNDSEAHLKSSTHVAAPQLQPGVPPPFPREGRRPSRSLATRTALNRGRDLHGSPAFVAQFTRWRLVPVCWQITKFIPELDDTSLGWKTNKSQLSMEPLQQKSLLPALPLAVFQPTKLPLPAPGNCEASLPIATSFQYWAKCSPMAFSKCRYSLASAKSCLLWVGSRTK